MAIFKVPRITTAQRLQLTLELSEILFDTGTNKFYGGDGVTMGGVQLGAGGFANKETVTLTQDHIENKQIQLNNFPNSLETVTLIPVGGIPQRTNIDFTLTEGNKISWDGLGLDNFLEVGDVLVITY